MAVTTNAKRKKKKNKTSTGFVLIILILILIILGIVLIIMNKFGNDNGSKKISVKNNTVEIEAGQTVEINGNDILNGDEYKITNAIIDTSTVDSNKVGKYDVKVICDNKTYIISVIVKDTVNPVIELHSDTHKVSTKQAVFASSLIKSINDITKCTIGILKSDGLSNVKDNMKESLSFSEPGTYTAYVAAIDESGNIATAPVIIEVEEVVHVDYLNCGAEVVIDANTDLNSFSAEYVPYGYGTEVDSNNRPGGCTWYGNKWGKFAVDFIQPMSNYIFLTFDEGYEYGNTPQILDTLKEKNAKAVFFVTLPFAKDNPDLIKRMLDEGHVIGNHTATHPSNGLCSVPLEQQISEIKQVHDFMLENYNYEMYLFRFPTGAFSDQSLAVVQSLGYRSVFWSFAHKDWDVNNQPDVKESLDKALNTAHGGEIFLLHGVSTTDTAMLPDLIDGLRAKGFEIGYYAKTI